MTAKITKRQRKAERYARRWRLVASYRDECRAEIARLRQLKSGSEAFTATLKRLRHEFTRAIAGRMVAA